MEKVGGMARAVAIQRACVVSIYALLSIAIVMAALAVERSGQRGSLTALVVMAVSGLPWLASRVKAEEKAYATPKTERVLDGAGAGARDER